MGKIDEWLFDAPFYIFLLIILCVGAPCAGVVLLLLAAIAYFTGIYGFMTLWLIGVFIIYKYMRKNT